MIYQLAMILDYVSSFFNFRVSFGSKGSMVETWIIEDYPEHQPESEDNFFKNLVNKADTGIK